MTFLVNNMMTFGIFLLFCTSNRGLFQNEKSFHDTGPNIECVARIDKVIKTQYDRQLWMSIKQRYSGAVLHGRIFISGCVR